MRIQLKLQLTGETSSIRDVVLQSYDWAHVYNGFCVPMFSDTLIVLLWLSEKAELLQSEIPNKRGWNKQDLEQYDTCQVKTYRVLQAEIRSLVGKVEVSRIWIIVILVSELTAWLLLGLSNRCEKWGSWSDSEVCLYSDWFSVGERNKCEYTYV